MSADIELTPARAHDQIVPVYACERGKDRNGNGRTCKACIYCKQFIISEGHADSLVGAHKLLTDLLICSSCGEDVKAGETCSGCDAPTRIICLCTACNGGVPVTHRQWQASVKNETKLRCAHSNPVSQRARARARARSVRFPHARHLPLSFVSAQWPREEAGAPCGG